MLRFARYAGTGLNFGLSLGLMLIAFRFAAGIHTSDASSYLLYLGIPTMIGLAFGAAHFSEVRQIERIFTNHSPKGPIGLSPKCK